MMCALRAAPHSVLSVPGQFGMFYRKCYKLLCSNALISVHQLTELGHAVTFTQDLIFVDDADLQYGMHFKKLTVAREWKMPLSALDRLAKLRLAHPRE